MRLMCFSVRPIADAMASSWTRARSGSANCCRWVGSSAVALQLRLERSIDALPPVPPGLDRIELERLGLCAERQNEQRSVHVRVVSAGADSRFRWRGRDFQEAELREGSCQAA